MKRGKSFDKPLTEAETREKLYLVAKKLGCYQELQQIFYKYDALLSKCTNATERQQIAVLGNVEIHKLFNFRDALFVNGQEILPADPDFKLTE